MTQYFAIRRFQNNDADDVSRLIIDDLTLVNIHDYGEAAVQYLGSGLLSESGLHCGRR